MCARYLDHRGYQQAAAITYFSVLSLVPVVMVVLSVTGYVLAGQPALLERMHHASQQAVPVAVQPLVAGIVEGAIDHRFGLGLAGIHSDRRLLRLELDERATRRADRHVAT
jgi:membrane protein